MLNFAEINLLTDLLVSTLLLAYFIYSIGVTINKVTSLDKLGVGGYCFCLILSRMYFQKVTIRPPHIVFFVIGLVTLAVPQHIEGIGPFMVWTIFTLMFTALPLMLVRFSYTPNK